VAKGTTVVACCDLHMMARGDGPEQFAWSIALFLRAGACIDVFDWTINRQINRDARSQICRFHGPPYELTPLEEDRRKDYKWKKRLKSS
jgi:hypothetical protein